MSHDHVLHESRTTSIVSKKVPEGKLGEEESSESTVKRTFVHSRAERARLGSRWLKEEAGGE